MSGICGSCAAVGCANRKATITACSAFAPKPARKEAPTGKKTEQPKPEGKKAGK